MFFRMLKKDLKRKKTMNLVLVIFVFLSAMFASSSVNNMIAVYGGIDYFFNKAGMPDFVAITRNSNGENSTEELVKNAESIKDYRIENIVYYSANNLKKDGEKYVAYENPGVALSIDGAKLNYFNSSDEVITEVPKGHAYLGGSIADPKKTTIGDSVCLEFGETRIDLVIDGYIKDAFLGSQFLGNPRLLLNDEDYAALIADEDVRLNYTGMIFYIDSDDMKALANDFAGVENSLFAEERGTIRMTYMLSMLVAALLLIVSICLILIAFTMLSFTIKFTLEEDFREIGVMKAVGLKNRSIRMMYMVKYLFLSVVGAFFGFFAGIPFGKMLLSGISGKMLIGNENSVLVGILSSVAVVLMILGFCYSCTKKINKLSPIDAVHNGETGERYHKKSVLRLSESRLGSNLFLALNDVLSKPRQYVSMTITFTLSLLLITTLANAANTLRSDKLLFLLGTTESDIYYSSTDKVLAFMGNANENSWAEVIENMEETLKENGMPATVHQELMYQLPVTFKDTKLMVGLQHCPATETTDYIYEDGVPPMYPNEVAFTPQILEILGADIGDKVKIGIEGEEKEYLITGTLISFNMMGKTGRLHQDVPLTAVNASSAYAFQIDFTDDPDEKTIAERKEKLKEIFDSEKLYDVCEYVDESTGSADAIGLAKNMVLIIALVITALITVLMERSFIGKETNEIALMKALGFKNRSISLQHTLRFMIVVLISSVMAMILDLPFTKVICDRIFAIMGAVSSISYEIRGTEIFILYPLILLTVISVTAYLTSLYAKTIHADDMGNIE